MVTQSFVSSAGFAHAARWAFVRLAVYVAAAVSAAVLFLIWAVLYTYVCPGQPAIISETPSALGKFRGPDFNRIVLDFAP